MMKLESRHEAAINAAGEAMLELGVYCSFSVTMPWREGMGPSFSFSGAVPGVEGQYTAGVARTPAEALRGFIDQANEIIANPPAKELTTAAEAKLAIKEIVEEARKSEVYPAELDEIADQIDALKVKG